MKNIPKRWGIASIVVLVLFIVLVAYDAWKLMRIPVQEGYEHCRYLCSLVVFSSMLWLLFLSIVESYLIYAKKQYSRWMIYLVYIFSISLCGYYYIASNVFEYIFNHIGAEHMHLLPHMVSDLFAAPSFLLMLFLFSLPTILKDAMKLKEEADLTI